MKDTYTIGEIAKLLKLGNDAIRFYEKKGLVHPSVNPENQYRMYDMRNILELLDIIYYRHLEISVSQIQALHQQPDKEKTKELMKRKKEETKRKIVYQQQLLKKISYTLDMCEHIDHQLHVCSIGVMPAFHILFENTEASSFFQHQIQQISEEEFVLCASLKQYQHQSDTLKKEKNLIVMEQQIAKELNIISSSHLDFLHERTCVTAILPLPQDSLSLNDIAPLLQFAKEHEYILSNEVYAKEIPLTFYFDHEHYYIQVFIPIKEK